MKRRLVSAALGLVGAMTAATTLSGSSADAAVDPTTATIYLSSSSAGQVDGIGFASGDILAYDQLTDRWSLFFDGSTVGLGTANVDGFHVVESSPNDATLHLTFSGPTNVPGVGRVDDSDVVTFTGALGAAPAGEFAMLLDASEVGLTSGGEDIDALTLINGDLAVSVSGAVSAPAANGGNLVATDEDLLAFSGTTESPATGGFSLLFDGSDTGFRTDAASAWIDPDTGEFYGSSLGSLNVPGLRGDGDDIFAFTGTFGDPTSGTYALFFDGDNHRFGGEQIDGLHIVAGQPSSPGQADLGVIIEDDVAEAAVAGETVTFGVDVTNNGPDAATNVVVTGLLPTGLTFLDTSGCEQDPAGLPCSLGSIDAGETVSFDLRATVSNGQLGPVSTSVSVTASTSDPEATNDSSSVETLISGPPVAAPDGAATNSVPGDPYHGQVNGAVLVDAPGLLVNDDLGSPTGQIVSFGGTDGGTAADHPVGSPAAVSGGTLTVEADGAFLFEPSSDTAGAFSFQYRLANDGGFSDAIVSLYVGPRPAVAGGDRIYLSTVLDGSVDGLNFADEDIVVYDTATDSWSLFFDGSDVGLGAADIDGFTIETLEPNPIIHLSLSTPRTIAGIPGTVDDSDVVTFTATSTGESTDGTFELLVDGSDMNLSSGGEDVDAVAGNAQNLLLSTLGSFNAGSGLVGGDEDLLNLALANSGSETTGVLSLSFDGSDVDLRVEDVSAASAEVDTAELYVAIFGRFSVPGLSGDGDDLISFTPTGESGFGDDSTQGTFSTFFDGDDHGFDGNQIDAAHVVRGVDEQPPPVDDAPLTNPIYAEGWHLDPPEVVFTDDGQSATVRLVQYGPDGQPTGQTAPSGITLIRPDPTYTITETSPGEFTVTGSDTVGTEPIGIEIPGQDDPVLLWVSSYRVRDDVTIVPTADIVFPPPGESTVTSVEPFTVAEVAARFVELTSTTNATVPVVLRGAAPAVGAKVSGSGIYGQVVEPSGAPSIQRDGLSLITLEIVPMTEIFAEVVIDVDSETLGDAGLVSGAVTTDSADNIGPDASGAAAEDTGGPSQFRATNDTPEPDTGCQASVNGAIGQNQLSVTQNLDRNFDVNGALGVDPVTGATVVENFSITGSIKGQTSVIFEGNLQLSGAVKLECTAFNFPTLSVAVPGPFALVLSGVVDLKIVIGVEVGAAATGIGFDYKAGCVATIDASATVSYSNGGGFTRSDPNALAGPTVNCADQTQIGFREATGAAEGGLKIFAQVVGEAGVRVGGKIAAFGGVILGNEDFGKVRPFVASFGPSLELSVENGLNAVNNKASKTGMQLNLVGELGLTAADITDIFGLVGVNFNLQLPKASFSTTLGTLLGPPSSNPLLRTIDGDSQSAGTVSVPVGSTLEVSARSLDFPPLSLSLSGDPILYEMVGQLPVQDDDFTVSGPGGNPTATLEMTEDLCSDRFFTERTYRFLAHLSTPPLVEDAVPVYLGEFTVECDRNLTFELQERNLSGSTNPDPPSEVELSPGNTSATFIMRQNGFDGKDWEIVDVGAQGTPFVTVTPNRGTFTGEETTLEVTLDCEGANEHNASTFYKARADGRQQDPQLDVTYDCSPDWIEASVDRTQLGGIFVLRSEGTKPDTWFASSRSHEPTPLSLASDDLPADEFYSVDLRAIDPRDEQKCGETQPASFREVSIVTQTRGQETVTILLPEKLPPTGTTEIDGEEDECDETDDGPPSDDEEDDEEDRDGPSGPTGDPHMTSFDGLRYDAQVLGEYEYAASADGNIRLVGRHERSVDGPTRAFAATSATALSLEVGRTKIETYARSTSLEVRVNGNVVTLPDGLMVDAGSGVSLTLNGDDLIVDAPGLFMQINSTGQGFLVPHLDLFAYTKASTPLAGMLGSNDGDAANDLTARDGSVISLAEARAHGPALYRFTDSWRITNPAESPFTLPSSVFDDPNEPRPTAAELAPYRAQALDLLGTATAMCSGDFEDGEYAVDVLAIELAIGRAVSDLSDYTCGYTVTGRLTTASPSGGTLGVAGAKVIVDADGLQPCLAVAAPNGTYVCTTSPDFDEVGDGSGVSFPLAFDIDVRAPGGDTVVVSSSGSFSAPPVFGAAAQSDNNDATLAAADVTIVDLSGTVSIFGGPSSASTSFQLSYTDDAGVNLGSRLRAIDPDTDGAYREAFVVPQTTDEVLVVWDRGVSDEARPSTVLTGLGAGVNQRTFDPTYDPPVADVSGIANINGSIPTQVLVTVDVTLDDGSVLTREVVAEPDQTTGAYTTDRVLPNDTASFVATAEVFGQQLISRSVTVDPVMAGSNPVTIDLDASVPILSVSGTLTTNGTAVTGSTVFTVEAATTGGPAVTLTEDVLLAADGSYSFAVDLPEDATSVTVTAVVGPTAADHPSAQLPTVIVGQNDLTLSADVGFPVVLVSGTFSSGGSPFVQDVPVRVITSSPQASEETVVANPTGDGSFSFIVELPGGTTAAELTAELGFGPDDHVVNSVTGLTDGDNAVSFDASFDAVVLDLSGLLTDRSTPVAGATVLDLKPFDVIGNPLPVQTETVFADGLGAYQRLIYLPDNATEVLIAARIGSEEVGRTYQMFDGLSAGLNPVVFSHDHNPPVLNISGSFTADGAPVAGLYDIVAVANFTNEYGLADSFVVRDEVFLSIIDGSYSLDLVLPEATSDATLTAEIGADVAFFPTLVIDPINRGANAVDFTADLSQGVTVQLNATLTVDGVGFSEQTGILYRAFDENDDPIGTEAEVSINPGSGGTDSINIELSPTARRLELAWVLTSGPTFESFDLTLGLNVVDYDVDIANVDVNISGTLTDDGSPFTDPTQIRVRALEMANGESVSNETVDVVPDSNGDYQFSRRLPATARAIELVWLDAFVRESTEFEVAPGVTDIVFDDDVGVIGAQRFELSGTITIGGDPWPQDFDILLRPRRLSGTSFPVQNTVTPDPATGAYTLSYDATQAITEVRVIAEGVDTAFPVDLTGTTSANLDFALNGQFVEVSGVVVEGPSPATGARVVLADASDTTNRTTQFPTLTATGAYDISFRTFTTFPSALIGVTNGVFDDDVRFGPDPFPISGGVTSIDDVDFDVAAPNLDVSGSLTENGSPVTDPVTFDITWTDDDPDLRSTWTSQVEITPDGNGDYSFSVQGPLRADRALVVADVAAPIADRSVEVSSLSNGTNPATLSVDFGTSELVISGTILDRGTPAADGPYPLTVTALDSSGNSLGSSSTEVTPDATDGSYTTTVAVPTNSAEATLEFDLTEYNYMTTEPNPSLVFTQATGALDADGSTAVTFDVSTTFVEVTGTVSTSDGTLRTGEFFNYSVQALDGSVELALVHVYEVETGFSTGAYTVGVYVPSGTTSAVIVTDFAGADPILVPDVAPGLTTQTTNITTDPFQPVTISGRLAVDGANPTGQVDFRVEGFATDVDLGGHLLAPIWFGSVNFGYVGSDGSGSVTLSVPPEVEVVEMSVRMAPGFDDYRRVIDLSAGSAPFTLNIDINATADRIQISGTSAVMGDPAIGPCSREGEVFLFNGTITGFTADPADAGTPPGVELFNGLVVPSIYPVSFNGVNRNWSMTASVPADITHLQVAYTTSGVEDPGDAQLIVTRDAVAYAGGSLDLVDNLIAGCGQ